MTTQPRHGNLWWSFVASWGLLVPVGILSLRQRVVCPMLELRPFDFLPLSGVVHGYDPHLLCRILHDLTHPFLLLVYAVVLASFGLWPIFNETNERVSRFLGYALPSLHLAFFVAYLGSLFLPIGDIIVSISPG